MTAIRPGTFRYRVLANRLRCGCALSSAQLRWLAGEAHRHRNFVLEARALAAAGWMEVER